MSSKTKKTKNTKNKTSEFISIRDIVSHRMYKFIPEDIDIRRTKGHESGERIVFVKDHAVKCTPNKSGVLWVGKKTYNVIMDKPKSEWTKHIGTKD